LAAENLIWLFSLKNITILFGTFILLLDKAAKAEYYHIYEYCHLHSRLKK